MTTFLILVCSTLGLVTVLSIVVMSLILNHDKNEEKKKEVKRIFTTRIENEIDTAIRAIRRENSKRIFRMRQDNVLYSYHEMFMRDLKLSYRGIEFDVSDVRFDEKNLIYSYWNSFSCMGDKKVHSVKVIVSLQNGVQVSVDKRPPYFKPEHTEILEELKELETLVILNEMK